MQIVKHIMTSKVYCLAPNDSLFDAYEIMKTCGVTHVPVVDDDRKVVGMVSQGDVLLYGSYKNRKLQLEGASIAKVMTRRVVTCLPSTSVANIAATMICCRIEAIPVVDIDQNLIGIVSSTDLLDYLCALEEDAGRRVMPIDFLERDPLISRYSLEPRRAVS